MNTVRRNILKPVATACFVTFMIGFALFHNRSRSWEELMARPGLNEKDFTRLFARAVKERYPQLHVEVVSDLEVLAKTPGGEELRSYLDNAWKQCATEPASRVEICKEHVEGLGQHVDSARLGPLKDDMGSIIPKIESSQYLDGLPLNEDGTKPFVAKHLVGDIWVVYARDMQKGIMLLPQQELSTLNLKMDELHDLAVKNLMEKMPEVRRFEYENAVSMITAGGTYEASLLLFDKLWEDQQETVDGDIIVAIPCRGMLLITGSDSRNGMKAIQQVTEEAWQNEAYCISRSLLVRRDGKWEVYRGR